MFKLKLWLTVVVVVAAGALLLLGGTGFLYVRVMPPYELASSSATAGVRGMLQAMSSETIDAAAKASSNPSVLEALKKGEMNPEAEAALLAPAGMSRAPSFAALVRADGSVVAKAGQDVKLEAQLQGFPVVVEALSGIARDGRRVLVNQLFHVVGAPVFEGSAPAGVVLLGWPYNTELVDRFAGSSGARVALIVGDTRSGSGMAEVSTEVLKQKQPSFGELALTVPPPLPVLVPDRLRYLATSLPLYPGDEGAFLTVAIDRNDAYQTLASAQVAVMGATGILALLLLVLIASTLRSINKPIEVIMDHLSQLSQGQQVGILPETSLSGPFLRLGKQINMILQSLPSATRPGSPLGNLSSPSNAMFAGSQPSLPPNFLGGGAPLPPQLPPEDPSDFPGLSFPESTQPAPPAPPRAPTPSTAPSTAPSTVPSSSAPAAPGPSSSAGFGASPPRAPTPMAQSPGAGFSSPPQTGLSGLFDEGADPLAAFRVPPPAPARSTPPVAAPAASLAPVAAPPPTQPQASMNPEATVMFQVPQELIQQSQQTSEMRAVPSKPHEDARTVVAQVPQELLSQAQPKSDVAPADEAHYKEVYDKFVATRVQCGEDTSDLTYDRFVAKLVKNRQQIIEKHKAKSVRFQVYVKEGKAALRALPVRE